MFITGSGIKETATRNALYSVANVLREKLELKAALKEKELEVRKMELELQKKKWEVEEEERKMRMKLDAEERRAFINLLKTKGAST